MAAAQYHRIQSTSTTHAHCFDKTLHVPSVHHLYPIQDDNDSNDDKTATTTSTSVRRAILLSQIQPNTHTSCIYTHTCSPYTPSSFCLYFMCWRNGSFLSHLRTSSVFRWIFHFVCLVIAAAAAAIAFCFFVSFLVWLLLWVLLFRIDAFNDIYW